MAAASLPFEIGNALSAMFRRGRITLPEARAVLTASRRIPLRLIDVDLDRALELAHRLGVYAYDAYVIVCALAESAPLVTLDGGQREAARRAGVELVTLRP